MWQDTIVAEVRKIREAHAAQYNYDLRAIYTALKKAEEQSQRPKVSFPPKRIAGAEEVKPALSGQKR
ncbi:MAG: hypothetical protein BroJett011_61050 [Chloroflexota bacterium]|nr:MAG: hypothetical protein BroJett011_61050 [Chloroflexota bacterium]